MNNSELLLRNSSIVGIPRPDMPAEDLSMIKENIELIKEDDLTKKKVKQNLLE